MSLFKQIIAAIFSLTAFISVSAAGAAQSGKIVVGVIPEVNLVTQMGRYLPLAEYLHNKTGLEIDVKPLANYGQLYEEMRDGNIDAGFFGSLVYGITRARIGIIPLVRAVNLNGKSTYTDLLFVSRDAGIKKPADMKGKTIALVDPATSAGYLAQREYLADHGIDMDRDLKILWTGSHEAAIRAVLRHQAEIGGAKDTVVALYRKENRAFDAVIQIFNENPSKRLPENTLAVRKGLAAEPREKLKMALLTMNSEPEGKKILAKFGAIRFITTSDEDFKPMYDWVRHLKLDLSSYPYRRPTH